MKTLLALSLLLLICAVIYFIHVAWKQAAENRRIAEGRPQSPADHDLYYITQQIRDAQAERDWRDRVEQNLQRREAERRDQTKGLSMFLRRQAG